MTAVPAEVSTTERLFRPPVPVYDDWCNGLATFGGFAQCQNQPAFLLSFFFFFWCGGV